MYEMRQVYQYLLRYLDRDVDPQMISRILDALSAAPTGGNFYNVEYTVIDDKERVREIWRLAYSKMESDAKRHITLIASAIFIMGR